MLAGFILSTPLSLSDRRYASCVFVLEALTMRQALGSRHWVALAVFVAQQYEPYHFDELYSRWAFSRTARLCARLTVVLNVVLTLPLTVALVAVLVVVLNAALTEVSLPQSEPASRCIMAAWSTVHEPHCMSHTLRLMSHALRPTMWDWLIQPGSVYGSWVSQWAAACAWRLPAHYSGMIEKLKLLPPLWLPLVRGVYNQMTSAAGEASPAC